VISIYNRYSAYNGFRKQERQNNAEVVRSSPTEKRAQAGMAKLNKGMELFNMQNLDASDLSLAAVLFLLYIESHDEDFLIILAVVAFSIFKDDDRKD
jgi:hypothetical protein